MRNAITAEPNSGAALDLPGDGLLSETFTDAGGRYVAHRVSPTCCSYDVTADGYQPLFGNVSDLNLVEGATVNFELVPLP